MRETHNIVGVHAKDPNMVGTLYLTDDGTLTRDPRLARKVPDSKLQKALKQIKGYSNQFFVRTVTD